MTNASSRGEGLTLRKAALIAGFAYLLNPVSYAEFTIYPKLIVAGNIAQTVANIAAHQGLFLTVFFCFLINFIGDIVIAWALYFLLLPVNRAVSLLAALFRLVYTAVALAAAFNLLTVYRMLTSPEYLALFGSGPLHAQIALLLHAFRYQWSMSLVVFGLHLLLVGGLIFRSGYLPKWLGVIVAINGLGWLIYPLQPYLFPNADLGFVFITFFGEVVLMLWLLIMGWRIRQPASA
jgi:hypothetical protein